PLRKTSASTAPAAQIATAAPSPSCASAIAISARRSSLKATPAAGAAVASPGALAMGRSCAEEGELTDLSPDCYSELDAAPLLSLSGFSNGLPQCHCPSLN